MLNKEKISKECSGNLTTFFLLLAILVLAFCKRGETATKNNNQPEKVLNSSGVTQKHSELTNQIVEIKKDGYYIDNKPFTMEEIAKKGVEWSKVRGKWTLLLAYDSIQYKRIDEVRETLANAGVYSITQSTAGSDEIVYPPGDVSEFAKFSQGDFEVWINQLINSPDIRFLTGHQPITFGFIVDKEGKVKDAHIIKGTDSPEKNAALEKILNQIPDWEPAMRGNEKVSVYYWMH
jgi:biopolymer transport protein ExbD